MTDHDRWYLNVATMIDGERRTFSLQRRYRPRRTGDLTIPRPVDLAFGEFIRECMEGSMLINRHPTEDHPYRIARYEVWCNGERVVDSYSRYPVKPEVLT